MAIGVITKIAARRDPKEPVSGSFVFEAPVTRVSSDKGRLNLRLFHGRTGHFSACIANYLFFATKKNDTISELWS